jgi:UDPglucose 6-dehydrogenase
MTKPKVAYAGMTHLGLCSAAAAASKGFATIGFSPDRDLVARLARGELPVVEPDLDDLIRGSGAGMRFSADASELASCDLIYVAPDVPTDATGASDLSPIDAMLDVVHAHARADAIVVVLSLVPPGFTRSRRQPERQLYYQVETLIFGRAVERATKPERFMVGCAEPSQPLPEVLATYLGAFSCPILPMRYESAELAKIAINCCLVASVSTANTLAELCESIGADWSEIVPALRLDRRIGPYSYLSPGLGIAGGNLERDLATVVALGDAHGTDVGVVRAWQANSRHRCDWVLRTLYAAVLGKVPDPKLALLGLAYKENTHSTKNSPALALLTALKPYPVRAFDPVVKPQPEWHPTLSEAGGSLDACAGADVLIIMTPWPQFRELKPGDIAARLRGKTIIDPFACLDRAACREAGLSHHVLGVPGSPAN